MIQTIKSLTPCLPGPWLPHRRFVVDKMKELDVRPGDILCRLGNAYMCGFFWFSRFIACITHSRYSHAAMITDVNDEIVIVDISQNGLRRQFVPEWTDDVWGDDILIVRYNGDPFIPLAAVDNVKSIESTISGYDDTFAEDGKFYCTELIHWSYLRAGINLCDETVIRNLPGWKWRYNWLARLNGININTPVLCVGNKKLGLLSSAELIKVGRIVLPSTRRQSGLLPKFAGA